MRLFKHNCSINGHRYEARAAVLQNRTEGKMQIERIEPLITAEQTIELVKLAVSSKTIELEKAVAMCLMAILKPPYVVKNEQNGGVDAK